MQLAELRALLTPEGLRLLDEATASTTAGVDPAGSGTAAFDAAALVERLRRAGHDPALVAAVTTQVQLRARAAAKFGPFAERMLFTRAGLEQATRLEIAARHAGRFRDAGLTRVADLGCGIGGDALGLAGLELDVLAVDADEVTAALAAYNLAPFGPLVEVRHARAEETPLADAHGVWLDPARRTAGHGETRRVGAGDYTPPLSWAFELARGVPAGVKLGPAFERDAIPSEVEAQWISVDGSTVELVLWSGALARDGVRRAALVVRGGGAHELTAGADAADEPVRELGAFLHEPEGAVIRARLIGEAARALEAGSLDHRIAYLTSDAALTSPFVQTFRVREELPFETRALAKELRRRGIGRLEIKKRGVDLDPAALRTKLRLEGESAAVLVLTRIGQRRRAILAERVDTAG